MVRTIQDKILKLKKENDVCILAHSYQAAEIVEIADFTGDSFQLSVMAQTAPQKTVILCGVHFMAETVKILSPEKRVILAHPQAGCPMAEQVEPVFVEHFLKTNPGYTVVAYINTTAALKTVCDVCVTSSTAVKIVQNIENENILFLPDCNLGDYVSKNVTGKNIKLWQGGCPIHAAVNPAEVDKAKELHPGALVLVHPECTPSVVDKADFVGSTSAIMEYAKQSDAKDFIIGTEVSIAEHLAYACPEKNFHILSKKLLCPNMKITSLMDVYKSLTGEGGLEIDMDEDTIHKARKCIDEMIRLGK
ncbi:MAG: quinolinate synthase [Clostridiales bacterium 43-6]|nr:MAG: quinolinate synthase [Clostridiales bacterium 43-6]